jgi:hypothetical protein
LAREAAKLAKSGGVPATAAAAPAEAPAAASTEDDLFTVKAVHSWGENAEDETPIIGDEFAGLSKAQQKKLKLLKLNRDGELKISQQTAKKVVFDEEGNAVDKTIRLIKSSADATAAGAGSSTASEKKHMASIDAQRIEEHARKVKERLDSGRKEDQEKERQRIREKRLQFKIAVGNNRKGGKDGDDSDGEEEEEGGGGGGGRMAVLGNAQEEEEGSDDGSDDESQGYSDEDDEDDEPRGKGRGGSGPAAAAKNHKASARAGQGSDSDSDSDAGSGSDSDSEDSTAHLRKAGYGNSNSKVQTKKRSNSTDSSSSSGSGSDSDNNSDSDEDSNAGRGKGSSSNKRKQTSMPSGNKKQKYSPEKIAEDERRVLAMLNAK